MKSLLSNVPLFDDEFELNGLSTSVLEDSIENEIASISVFSSSSSFDFHDWREEFLNSIHSESFSLVIKSSIRSPI